MEWFNFIGLVFVIILLVPNIVFAVTHKDGFENNWSNKTVELFEQIGRFGCFILMVFSVPKLTLGFWFEGAKTAYVVAGFVLLFVYCLGWVIFWKESSVKKALLLSVTPSLLFLESGILTLNIPLIVLSAVFSVCHITLSYNNAKFESKQKSQTD